MSGPVLYDPGFVGAIDYYTYDMSWPAAQEPSTIGSNYNRKHAPPVPVEGSGRVRPPHLSTFETQHAAQTYQSLVGRHFRDDGRLFLAPSVCWPAPTLDKPTLYSTSNRHNIPRSEPCLFVRVHLFICTDRPSNRNCILIAGWFCCASVPMQHAATPSCPCTAKQITHTNRRTARRSATFT